MRLRQLEGARRLELSGAALARNTVRIMVVKSAVAQPEFLVPLDALFLSPGTGTYVSLVQRVLCV